MLQLYGSVVPSWPIEGQPMLTSIAAIRATQRWEDVHILEGSPGWEDEQEDLL